jgi:hypothetical protein
MPIRFEAEVDTQIGQDPTHANHEINAPLMNAEPPMTIEKKRKSKKGQHLRLTSNEMELLCDGNNENLSGKDSIQLPQSPHILASKPNLFAGDIFRPFRAGTAAQARSVEFV